jgi:hypothetical protein
MVDIVKERTQVPLPCLHAGCLSGAAFGSPTTPLSKGTQLQQLISGMNPPEGITAYSQAAAAGCGPGRPMANELRSPHTSYSIPSHATSLAGSFRCTSSSLEVNEILQQYTVSRDWVCAWRTSLTRLTAMP